MTDILSEIEQLRAENERDAKRIAELEAAVDEWLAECTDGRVSDHTVKMLKTFARWAAQQKEVG